MKTICIIPARLNSSRFPGKLLAMARGKTVLQHTFESALLCKELNDLYVATDSEEIASHIEALRGKVIWTSPDCRNGTERIAEALRGRPDLQRVPIVVNVQGDHPCTSPEAIQAVVRLLKEDPNAVMATAAVPLKNPTEFHSPHVVKCVFDQQFNALYFSRAPIPYSKEGIPKNAYHHIGLYAYRTSFLLSNFGGAPTPLQIEEDLEQLNVLEKGFRIKVALVDDLPIGIDTPEDLEKFKKLRQLQNSST